MKQFRWFFPALLALSLAAPVGGETTTADEGNKIYMTTDENGNTVFSDSASPGAREIQVREAITLPSSALEDEYNAVFGDEEEAPAEPAYRKYRSLSISSPGEDEAIRANNGDISIAVSIAPAAAPNHRIELLVDGNPVEQVSGPTEVMLQNVDRGTHQAQLRVTDRKTGKVLEVGPSRTFHVLRASRLN